MNLILKALKEMSILSSDDLPNSAKVEHSPKAEIWSMIFGKVTGMRYFAQGTLEY